MRGEAGGRSPDRSRTPGEEVRAGHSGRARSTVQAASLRVSLNGRGDALHQPLRPAPAHTAGVLVPSPRYAARVADGRHTRCVAEAVGRLLHGSRRYEALNTTGAAARHA